MDKPEIAGYEPIWEDVKKGESYWWCSCGKSQNQPYCDGSHAGTSFEPMEFVAPRNKSIPFCSCKYTKKPPYCDGAHDDLIDS